MQKEGQDNSDHAPGKPFTVSISYVCAGVVMISLFDLYKFKSGLQQEQVSLPLVACVLLFLVLFTFVNRTDKDIKAYHEEQLHVSGSAHDYQ